LAHDFTCTFPLAYGGVLSTGSIKSIPEDFVVNEQLSFPLSGSGEHIYLRIRKRLTNTHWVQKQLARHFGCPARDIGYAGLKDRQAVTTQWFSMPVKYFRDDKAAGFDCEEYAIIDAIRHTGKLRRGAIKHNEFEICIRNVQCDAAALAARITAIARNGVPNYYGEQRFGIGRNNLHAADQWCQRPGKTDRFKRGIYLSAMRSWLFNLILAERVRQGNWCSPVEGDVYFLEGSKRYFHEATISDALQTRMTEGDIHPAAPLWGSGDVVTTSHARQLETTVLEDWWDWQTCLERAGLKQERRACRVIPREFAHDLDAQTGELRVRFALPAGSYATGLLREIIDMTDAEPEHADE